jgi:hypothetical protein
VLTHVNPLQDADEPLAASAQEEFAGAEVGVRAATRRSGRSTSRSIRAGRSASTGETADEPHQGEEGQEPV